MDLDASIHCETRRVHVQPHTPHLRHAHPIGVPQHPIDHTSRTWVLLHPSIARRSGFMCSRTHPICRTQAPFARRMAAGSGRIQPWHDATGLCAARTRHRYADRVRGGAVSVESRAESVHAACDTAVQSAVPVHVRAIRAIGGRNGRVPGARATVMKGGRQACRKTPHKLRHTFCSHLAMRGAAPRAIQDLAGHANFTTTQRYMHLSPSTLSSAIDLLEKRGDILETGTGLTANSNAVSSEWRRGDPESTTFTLSMARRDVNASSLASANARNGRWRRREGVEPSTDHTARRLVLKTSGTTGHLPSPFVASARVLPFIVHSCQPVAWAIPRTPFARSHRSTRC